MDLREATSTLKLKERTIFERMDLLEVPRRSYQQFLEKGLGELFKIFFPIKDYTGTMVLEFVDYRLGEPLHTEEECKAQSLTYDAPLYVKFRLINYSFGEEITESEVNLCDIPLMTKRGTFIINGSEKVVVNQLTRAPGIYFDATMGVKKGGAVSYKGELIPAEGSWIKFRTEGRWLETIEDSPALKISEAIYVTLGKSRNFPITLLIRALNSEYLPIKKELLVGRIANEMVVDRRTGEVIVDKGEVITEETAERIEEVRGRSNWDEPVPIEPRIALMRDDVIKVVASPGPSSTTEDLVRIFGEEQVLERPTVDQLLGKWVAEDVVINGEVIARAFTKIDKKELARKIEKLQLERVVVYAVPKKIEETLKEDMLRRVYSEDDALKAFYKAMRTGDEKYADVKGAEALLSGYLGDLRHYDLGVVGRRRLNEKLSISVPEHVRWLTKEDFIAIAKYMVELAAREEEGAFEPDDIDHMKNKRVRPVGELLQLFLRPYFLQLERAIRERMASIPREKSGITPEMLIYARPLEGAIKAFFATGQLTQFMDQTNPLSELTHKRRLSVLGPGGLTRRSVSWEVRNVHPSHYGKICPIETPEGPNVGLITSLTSWVLVNQDGFLVSPYWKLENGRIVGKEPVYLDPEEEEKSYIVPADAKVDEQGRLVDKYILVRYGSKFLTIEREKAQYMEVAPEQVFSLSASLIPFLEHDDADRALMGANYQRQAVPLLIPQAPIIKTGMEAKVAESSQAVVVANAPGIVEKVDAREIVVRRLDGEQDVYRLYNFQRSNAGTCIHQRPIVEKGDRVREGQVLADSLSTDKGELALGANLLIAYMPWEGYNYEDAIVISERIVREDVLTSIHIEEYEVTTRNTPLGPEEITRDIPGVGDEALKDLDDYGIIRIGARVGPHDILVGKITPKAQRELTPEEKLVIAIFGKKGEDVKDESLRMPHGERGIVVDVKVFSRFKYFCPRCGKKYFFSKEPQSSKLSCEVCGAEIVREEEDTLPQGINAMVKVYVAQVRPIMVGDKLSGRHGNKGVIAKILPIEDMPHLPDGTPVDIVLNPLGVPSRMNIGQLYELHLGWVGKNEGISYVCPIFRGPKEEEIKRGMARVVDKLRREKLFQILEEVAPGILFNLQQRETFEEMLSELEKLLGRISSEELARIARRIGVKGKEVKKICERLREMVDARIGFDENTGKCTLIDGRTGEPFSQKVAIGYGYIMKLEHLAEDKMHARSTGTYSLITQQPLGGKAQFGGQRFGEMEVWALEAYGAAHTLQEMLTIKSDDVQGRSEAYSKIVRGEPLELGGIPESFNILVRELRSLALDVIPEEEDIEHEMEDVQKDSEEGDENGDA